MKTSEEKDVRENAPPPPYQVPGSSFASLDVPQRIERKLAQYNASSSVFKHWLFEIISWSTSAVYIGFIIEISVNVLGKTASACHILPIPEAIGQLKWTWFNGTNSKDMIDFEIFDKASRGAWGSFLLLFWTIGRSLAALGAILTLLLLATDTFFQQLTDLPEQWTLERQGSIPRSVRYEGDNGDLYQEGFRISLGDLNLRQITFKYFYYNGNEPVPFGNGTRPDITVSCPPGRCDWDPYESLGFFSACADVSELLRYACLTTKLDWISSAYLNESTHPTGKHEPLEKRVLFSMLIIAS
ncbi:hypothetical protein BDU57DRAFT_108196 [Ampelomyces quisqualis]|uniref:Uncharacterized protein n=1 Tax=Ampelomyces quisqualis TaxID=50730 RepID=A0A6A5Q8A7_AMPQU|nr:hypothetical protein BDU57DRAFT_108196 [Ampelomyces quisqualis]